MFLRYTHAGKVWDFLRNDRSNKLVTENETNKTDHPPTSPLPTYGPVPLYKWPEPKTEITEEAPSSQSNVGLFRSIIRGFHQLSCFVILRNNQVIKMTPLQKL